MSQAFGSVLRHDTDGHLEAKTPLGMAFMASGKQSRCSEASPLMASVALWRSTLERVPKCLKPSLFTRSSQTCAPTRLWSWITYAHKGARVRKLIEAAGCGLLFTPPYSPEFNPIEEAWSKLKDIVRRAYTRTRKAFDSALAKAIQQVTKADILGWFRYAGYRPISQTRWALLPFLRNSKLTAQITK